MYEGCRIHGEDYKRKKLRYLIADHFMKTYEMKKFSESDEVVGKSKLVSASYERPSCYATFTRTSLIWHISFCRKKQ
jgi:hypothetical protein